MNKFSPLKSKKKQERISAANIKPDHWIMLSINFVYYIILFPSNFLTDSKNPEYLNERFIIMSVGVIITLAYFLLIFVKGAGKYLRLISTASVIWTSIFFAQLPRYIEIQNEILMGVTTALSLSTQIALTNFNEIGPLVFTLVNVIVFLKQLKGGVTSVLFTHNIIISFLLYLILRKREKYLFY